MILPSSVLSFCITGNLIVIGGGREGEERREGGRGEEGGRERREREERQKTNT